MRAFNPTGWSLYAVSHITWRISWAKLAIDHYLKDPYDMEIVPRVNISTVNHADLIVITQRVALAPLRVYLTRFVHARFDT